MSLIGPASNVNWTCSARPSGPVVSTSVCLTALVHSGYAAKSAITAMIRAGGASMTMDWVDSSAMPGGYRQCAPSEQTRSPAQHVWLAGALEVPDVHALG